MIFGKGSIVSKIPIRIRGNNCLVQIGDGVIIRNRLNCCDILCEGDNVKIIIGDNTSIQSAHINAQEDNSQLIIGHNCMLSESIVIRTSDSHPIFDSHNIRINKAKNVIINNHVWISARAVVLKGTTINDGAIVGVGAIVSGDVPANSIVAGVPARILKTGIYWKHKI